MTKITRILPVLTFMIVVVILVLNLWPILGDAPWEDGVTEAELSKILQEEAEASDEEKEADREAKCEGVYAAKRLIFTNDELMKTALENHCYREDGTRRY